MAIPEFVVELRAHIGHAELWLPGVTVVVVRAVAESDGSHPPLLWHSPLDPQNVEILVVQRADNQHWTPVTGIIDPREEPAVAGVREIKEETGVVAQPVRLLSTEVVGPVTYPNGDVSSFLDLSFAFEWVSGEPYPADGENLAATFVRADQLPALNERFTRAVAGALAGRPGADFVGLAQL